MEEIIKVKSINKNYNIEVFTKKNSENSSINVNKKIDDSKIIVNKQINNNQIIIKNSSNNINTSANVKVFNTEIGVKKEEVFVNISNKGGIVSGKSGLSAYEIAVKNGFPGSETDWLASLRGQDGLGAVAIAYVHEQNIPSNIWMIPHKLGFYPNIRITNSAGDSGFAQIQDIDVNNSKVIFDGAMAGRAYCS